ncbi:MAG TPA: hypothetical protein VGD80_25570 [Kofleriaceae bacterium]
MTARAMTRAGGDDARASAARDRRVAWVAAVAAWIVVAAFVAGKAARDAILLASFDVAHLPVFVGIASALSLPIVIGAGRVMGRIGPGRLMAICHVGSAALLVVEWLALARWPAPAAVAVFFQISALGALLVSGFWSIVNERFDARAAKHHIARIGMAATLGGIAGGVIAERTAVLLSTDKLLLVLAGLHLAAALALRLLGTGARRALDARTGRGRGRALRVIARSSLLRNLAVVVVLGAIAGSLLDFVLKAQIAGSSNGVLRSLALYYTVTNVVTAVVQIVFGGALIARLGVPRSIAALPLAVVSFGTAALAVPAMWTAAIARGAEAVTRNSVYRLAYELLYAPLPEHHKRPTKVVLDVGAERIGDLIGAQLVGAVIYLAASPWLVLQGAAIGVAALALVFAARLPGSYRKALEQQLLVRAPSEPPAATPAWQSLAHMPALNETGDLTAMSLLFRADGAAVSAPAGQRRGSPDAAVDLVAQTPADRLAELRSGQPARVRSALDEPLDREHVPDAIALIAWDEVAPAALAALTRIAPRSSDLLVAALLDRDSEFAVRRRLPGVLVAGDPAVAVPGLWRGLGDPRFEVRYRSGAALAQLVAAGHAHGIAADDVFAAVHREIAIDLRVWQSHRLLDAPGDDAVHRVLARRSSAGLVHVFTLLGLALPAAPLRVALQAVQAGDRALRATALEYLESVLPPEIRTHLWPFLEVERAAPPAVRSRTEVLAALVRSHPSIRSDLAGAERPIRPRNVPSLRQLNADWTRAAAIQRTSHSS